MYILIILEKLRGVTGEDTKIVKRDLTTFGIKKVPEL